MIQHIEHPKNRQIIIEAQNLDEKHRFFSEKFFDYKEFIYGQTYIDNAKKIINNTESFNKFINNFNYPLKSSQMITKIFQQLEIIFRGEDKNILFTNASGEPINTVDNLINLNFYQKKLFKYYKTAPNTRVMLKDDGEVYFIDSQNIIDFEMDGEDEYEYFTFKNGNEIYDINKDFIYEYEIKGDKYILKEQYINVYKFVPVFHVSNEILNSKNNFVRCNIYTEFLGDFENLERLEVFKKILSPHAFYNYILRYKEDLCNYRTDKTHCQNGFMYRTETNELLMLNDGTPYKCPVCNSSVGIGNEIKIPKYSVSSSELNIVNDPIRFVAPSPDILKYSDEFLVNKKKELYDSILGIENNLNDKVAQTAEAYKFNSQTRQQVISNLKTEFEDIIVDIEEAKLKIVGKEQDRFSLTLGTKFLTQSYDDILSEYKEAKENGVANILDYETTIIQKKYENDQDNKARSLILSRFYPNIDTSLLASLPDNKIKLKHIYFYDFINWVEANKMINYYNIDTKKVLNELEKYFDEYLKVNQILVNTQKINTDNQN